MMCLLTGQKTVLCFVFQVVLKDVKKTFKNVLAQKIASLGVKNDFGPQHG